MSQTPPPEDFGRFSKVVASFKLFVTDSNPFLKTCDCADSKFTQPLNIKDNYKQWTMTDLNTLANGAGGVPSFNGLVALKNAAAKRIPELDKEKTLAKLEAKEKALGHTMTDAEYAKYQKEIPVFKTVLQPFTTDDGLLAQKALAHLAPAGKTWRQFADMIQEVDEKTAPKRKQLRAEFQKYEDAEKAKGTKQGPSKVPNASVQNKVGAVFSEQYNITIDPSDDKGFDQQTALAILGERGVKVDVDQSHKTPNFEQEALKAVASLKNTVITRAA